MDNSIAEIEVKTIRSTPQGEVSWNFEKFLVNRQGQVIGRYRSAVDPNTPELIRAIEQALNQ